MKSFIFFIFVSFLVFVYGDDCPTIHAKHYQELNCKPVIEDGSSCPTSYECPEFLPTDPEKCLVNGIYYERGDKIADVGICRTGCFCDTYALPAVPTCANIECPELFRPSEPGCIKQKGLDKCCAEKTICDQDEISKLGTCEFEGKTYRDGESMYSDKYPCYTCQCKPDFDNSKVVGNPNCRIANCDLSTRVSEFKRGCAPVYYGKTVCCPIDWRCPSESEDSVVESSTKSANSALQCSFGKLKLNVGDSLNNLKDNTKCSCATPPYVHCERNN